MTGLGLGPLLMRRIIDYARSRSIRVLFGDVLHENVKMLVLCRNLGFTAHMPPEDIGVVRVELDLTAPKPGPSGRLPSQP